MVNPCTLSGKKKKKVVMSGSAAAPAKTLQSGPANSDRGKEKIKSRKKSKKKRKAKKARLS